MSATIAKINDGRHHFTKICDFCGLTEEIVPVLIESVNGTHICNGCVEVCNEILAGKQEESK